MKHKTLFSLLATLGLVLALGSSIPMPRQVNAQSGMAAPSSAATAAQAGSGYISVAPGAFHPVSDDCDYINYGSSLYNGSGGCAYVAPVQLPQGATVTKVTAYWADYSSDQEANVFLNRVSHGDVTDETLAWMESSGSSGDGSSEDTSISYATIDNSLYAYYVWWGLPDVNLTGKSIVVEYTYSTSLPLVQRDS
jgi:hypothetical protein